MTTILLATILALTPPPAESDARLLAAIHAVENGPRSNPGNLSPAAKHDNRDDAGHLRWLRETLLSRGYVPTTFILALCWRAGLPRVTDPYRAKELEPYFEYAARVRNLFEASTN